MRSFSPARPDTAGQIHRIGRATHEHIANAGSIFARATLAHTLSAKGAPALPSLTHLAAESAHAQALAPRKLSHFVQ